MFKNYFPVIFPVNLWYWIMWRSGGNVEFRQKKPRDSKSLQLAILFIIIFIFSNYSSYNCLKPDVVYLTLTETSPVLFPLFSPFMATKTMYKLTRIICVTRNIRNAIIPRVTLAERQLTRMHDIMIYPDGNFTKKQSLRFFTSSSF